MAATDDDVTSPEVAPAKARSRRSGDRFDIFVVGLILTGPVVLPDAVTDSIESYTEGSICLLAGVLALVVSRNRNRTET